MHYVLDAADPATDAEFAARQAALVRAERWDVKHDGANGALVWEAASGCWRPYARFDIQRVQSGRAGGGKAKAAAKKAAAVAEASEAPLTLDDWQTARRAEGSGWIECEPMPTASGATHWPHLRPCDEDPRVRHSTA
jgi:hypothetical protein